MFKHSLLSTIAIAIMCIFLNGQTAHAALKVNPEGSWKVTSKTVSGAVGNTVPLEFSITAVSDRCIPSDFVIKTTNEARQKVSFVGVTVPVGGSVSPESIDWTKPEFEAGVTQKYRVNVRIDRGSVGDEIDGFHIYVYCGFSIVSGVIDDAVVKVVAKSTTPVSKTKAISSADLTSIFKSVYGRNLAASEKKYWAKRWLDKPDRTALKGAMAYHKQKGIRH